MDINDEVRLEVLREINEMLQKSESVEEFGADVIRWLSGEYIKQIKARGLGLDI